MTLQTLMENGTGFKLVCLLQILHSNFCSNLHSNLISRYQTMASIKISMPYLIQFLTLALNTWILSKFSTFHWICLINVFSSKMRISQPKWECLHRLTRENMLCTQKKAVYTVFSQPVKFKLGTQTFLQHTLCQHNILPACTVLTQCGQ